MSRYHDLERSWGFWAKRRRKARLALEESANNIIRIEDEIDAMKPDGKGNLHGKN